MSSGESLLLENSCGLGEILSSPLLLCVLTRHWTHPRGPRAGQWLSAALSAPSLAMTCSPTCSSGGSHTRQLTAWCVALPPRLLAFRPRPSLPPGHRSSTDPRAARYRSPATCRPSSRTKSSPSSRTSPLRLVTPLHPPRPLHIYYRVLGPHLTRVTFLPCIHTDPAQGEGGSLGHPACLALPLWHHHLGQAALPRHLPPPP